jgi:hypothetical protein
VLPAADFASHYLLRVVDVAGTPSQLISYDDPSYGGTHYYASNNDEEAVIGGIERFASAGYVDYAEPATMSPLVKGLAGP